MRVEDGWIALNLARTSDRALLPALRGGRRLRDQSARALVETAQLLGLPLASVGETRAGSLSPPTVAMGRAAGPRGNWRVVDLSSLWAGPLCAAILAEAGAHVTRVESRARPDPTRRTMPALDRRLNGGKRHVVLDFADRAALLAAVMDADIVVTSARRRAFEQLGCAPEVVFSAKPGLIWVAISGHGWQGDAADRVAFGDDAAAAGGLVNWHRGQPHFAGDALADPLTGLAAAAAALEAMEAGGGVLIDAAMARVAAGAATGVS
jgi:crotonobetainyl-CoA:carnitine CoA-transferase CaiB-like acyl-CoA transferase